MKKGLGEQSTILLVDDEIEILEILKSSLESFFSDILLADRALKAIEILKVRRVDCIVTDYRMPEMNGIQFIDYCLKAFPTVPIILLTGNSSDSEVVNALENGLFDLLEKPYKEFVLINRIRNALLLPKLESLIMDIVNTEFPDINVDHFLNLTPSYRLKAIGGLDAMVRLRLQAKGRRKSG